jgi:hypothetical protein
LLFGEHEWAHGPRIEVPGAHNGLLYSVTRTDHGMLGAAFLRIILVAILAGAIPAYRVARVDPALALRNE